MLVFHLLAVLSVGFKNGHIIFLTGLLLMDCITHSDLLGKDFFSNQLIGIAQNCSPVTRFCGKFYYNEALCMKIFIRHGN